MLLRLVRRSLRQHALSTTATALAIALAGGLLLSVWTIKTQAQTTFTQANTGFDAVLGARGSKLQLVLNAIFHLEASPGNITQADYLQIKKHPAVKHAIPIAVGDNLRGYRIVGTDPELFTDIEYAPGKKFTLAAGRLWPTPEPTAHQPETPNPKPETAREASTARSALLGSYAAQQLRLRPGDTFHPYHGLNYDEAARHPEIYTVTGILAPTNTPADKVVWIPLAGVQTMEGHDPAAATDVSAVLIQLRSSAAGFMLDLLYNRQGNRLTFAYPVAAIIGDLFSKISWFDRVLTLVAILVALVSALTVLVAIYNTMLARRRDHAILRALGAHRRTLFGAVVLEATAIGVLGMLAALVIHGLIATAAAVVIRRETGVVIAPWTLHTVFLYVPLGMIALCALAGLIPAWKAYRTDIAENLAPTS